MEGRGHRSVTEEEKGPSGSSMLVLPLFVVGCSVVSVLLLMASGLGTRLDLWQFRTGFSILRVAAYSGLG